MYAQLGNIVFEILKGFDSYDDMKSVNYAEHALIENKPRLQPVGENLDDVNIVISFNRAFCIPENEYNAFVSFMRANEILPFIYGNGNYEGDYVIQSIKKKILNAADDGSFIEITCDLVLKEFYDSDKAKTQRDKAKKSAFAINTNNPRPANSIPSTSSPALSTNIAVGDSKKATNAIDGPVSKIKKQIAIINGLIEKGQKFVDMAQVYQAGITKQLDTLDASLLRVQDKINAYSSINIIAPGLQGALTNAINAGTAARAVVSTYGTLPGVVNTTVEALAVLGVFNNTVKATADLVKFNSALNAAATPLAALSGIRRN